MSGIRGPPGPPGFQQRGIRGPPDSPSAFASGPTQRGDLVFEGYGVAAMRRTVGDTGRPNVALIATCARAAAIALPDTVITRRPFGSSTTRGEGDEGVAAIRRTVVDTGRPSSSPIAT